VDDAYEDIECRKPGTAIAIDNKRKDKTDETEDDPEVILCRSRGMMSTAKCVHGCLDGLICKRSF
jgi:hypothetical protein